MNVGGAGFTWAVVIGLFGGFVVGVLGREGGDASLCCIILLFVCQRGTLHHVNGQWKCTS